MKRGIHLILLALIGAMLGYAGLYLPARGEHNAPADQHVSPYYITHAIEETETPNIVTAIIADYRSFDTLGETLVIFTAGLAALFIMGKRKEKV